MIGERVLVGLQNSSKGTRDIIAATYPLSIDGAACRGTVRNNCGANGNPQIPAAGLPSSAYDVIKANTGQLGDIVVLATGYSDLVSSPSSNPPDLSPFNKDFELVMNQLQAEPRVQRVLVLNLRTSDSRISALQLNKYNAINGRLPQYLGTFSKMAIGDFKTGSAGFNCGGTDDGCFPNDPIIPGSSTGAPQFATWLKGQLDAIAATPGTDGEGTVSGSRCAPSAGFGFGPYVYTHDGSGYPAPPPGPQAPDPGRFNAVTPLRILDTRGGQPLGTEKIRRIQVAGVGNGITDIPANATAVALNVTAVSPCGPGFLTVFPCGPVSPPDASNVNFGPGQTVPNAVTVRVGSLGRICVRSASTQIGGTSQADIIVDINGYYNDQGAFHASQDPFRIVDTRPGTPSMDPGKVPVTAGTVRQISLAGAPGVTPGQTTAVALNVTAVTPQSAGFLTVFPGPCGNSNIPNASNLNYGPGQVVPNYVAVKVPNSGLICVYSFATTHLIVDLNAAFNPAGTVFRGTTPTRVVDTRPGADALLTSPQYKTRLSPNVPFTVPVLGAAALPGGTSGVLFNTTIVAPSGNGFLTVYPCGSPIPTASNLNYTAGQVVPNLVDAKIGSGGSVCFVSTAATDLLLDLTGYYS